MKIRPVWQLLRDTVSKWLADEAPRLGAALAFYTMLSLAPLLVIVTAVAGWVLGPTAAQGRLVQEVEGFIGPQGAEVIQMLLSNAYQQPGVGLFAAVAGTALLLFGAAGVFNELQGALNTIWGAWGTSKGLLSLLRDRFLSFLMVLGLAFIQVVSLVLSTALAAMSAHASPDSSAWLVLRALHLALGMGIVTVLFAVIFKVLPDAVIAWRDVWVGAVVTAGLFTLGKYLIGLYLGQSSVGSAYGAAGSFAVFLIWVYYSAQILLLGAEFTQLYANRFGSRVIVPGAPGPAFTSSQSA